MDKNREEDDSLYKYNKTKILEPLKIYFRQVIAAPHGIVTHCDMCRIWSWNICTCGLLNILIPYYHSDGEIGDELRKVFPDFDEQQGLQDRIFDDPGFLTLQEKTEKEFLEHKHKLKTDSEYRKELDDMIYKAFGKRGSDRDIKKGELDG